MIWYYNVQIGNVSEASGFVEASTDRQAKKLIKNAAFNKFKAQPIFTGFVCDQDFASPQFYYQSESILNLNLVPSKIVQYDDWLWRLGIAKTTYFDWDDRLESGVFDLYSELVTLDPNVVTKKAKIGKLEIVIERLNDTIRVYWPNNHTKLAWVCAKVAWLLQCQMRYEGQDVYGERFDFLNYASQVPINTA